MRFRCALPCIACSISPKIHENYGIAITDWAGAINPAGFYKLVVFFALISILKGLRAVGCREFSLACGEHVVGYLHPIPTLVTVHRIVTSDDRSNAYAVW